MDEAIMPVTSGGMTLFGWVAAASSALQIILFFVRVSSLMI